MNKKIMSVGTILLLIGSIVAMLASAQAAEPATVPGQMKYQYAAKFVCGDGESSDGSVASSTYFTDINVHNPQWYNLWLYKKFVIASPEDSSQQLPSKWYRYWVGKDRAFEVDCSDIAGKYWSDPHSVPPFYKGYVVISADRQLDVTGVYTSSLIDSSGAPTQSTFYTMNVEPKYKTLAEYVK